MTTPVPMLPPEAAFAVIVYGSPGPQGSKKAKGTYRTSTGKVVPNLVESSAKVKPWREAVHTAAQVQIMRQRGRFVSLTGPLVAEMHFTMPAPKRMPKDRILPSVYPDLSKLARSTEDALTTAGVWADDGLVVRYLGLSKTYPGVGGHALDRPGVIIRIWRETL